MSADNFNKKPDNSINQDEELTAILQRLSSLLDKSVSLDEAIELAKQQSNTDSSDTFTETEEKQETEQEELSEEKNEIDAYAELIEKKRAASLETPADTNTQETMLDEEKNEEAVIEPEEPFVEAEEPIVETEEPIVEAEEPIVEAEEPTVEAEEPIVEAEEPIVEAEEPTVEAEEPIAEAEENNQSDKSMPVSDFIKLLKSKRFTEPDEQSEETESATEDTQTEEESSEEEPIAEEQEAPVEEILVNEQTRFSEDEILPETAPVEEKVFDDENELIAEKKPLFDETATPQESITEEDSATSKIFDELLACFDERNIPDNSRSPDNQPAEEESEVNEEVLESQTETEDVSAEEQEYEEPEEEPIPEFVPIEHENPEEDELFSKIFSEEKSERKNRERDKKKWQAPGDAPSPFLSGLYDWLEVIVLSAAFALLLFTFILRLAIVDGDSMNHTLHDKELLIISDLMYTPENNDIIVFTSPNYPDPIVKRIIATEGQTVDIDFDTWTVTVDGKVLEEDYINRVPGVMKSSDVAFPLTVPEGYIFVMGDNRNDSLDSRNSRIGFVDERFILGEVKLRVFPFDRFGTVD